QFVCRRRKLFSLQRRCESGPDHNRQCTPRRRTYSGASRMKRLRCVFALLVLALWPASAWAAGRGVEAIGMTVADIDRSGAFCSQVLSFQKFSDVEIAGSDYEHLEGIFGLRMRVVSLKLGDETLILTEYLAPKGRPFPADSRSNDRWFQHVAIVVSDMDRAY